jgi:MoxR-like ATPase
LEPEVSLSELTDRQAVLSAIAEFDDLGRDAFLRKYGFGSARSFWLKHDGKLYDSKAIAGAAFGFQFPGRGPLRAGDFSGGEQTVRPALEKLGFEFEDDVIHDDLIQRFLNIRVGTLPSGAPAPHKPLLLLVALRRLRHDLPRISSADQIAAELEGVLTSALPDVESPSPWEPIWRLEPQVWEVADDAGKVIDRSQGGDPPIARLRAHSAVCGLTEQVHEALLDQPEMIPRIEDGLVDRYLSGVSPDVLESLLERGSRRSRVWWVNQGKTYRQEREGSFVWAPLLTKSGRPAAHHVAVNELRPGDVVIHYSGGYIRALGLVSTSARVVPRPSEFQDDTWGAEGYRAEVRYSELDMPIALDEIPDRPSGNGPFNTAGGVKQGYLFPVRPSWAEELRERFSSRWPVGSPWSGGQKWLFQANPETWDLAGRLQTWEPGESEWWTVSRYRSEIRSGDDVALFASGPSGGILALGSIEGEPVLRPRPDWLAEAPEEIPSVEVLLRKKLDSPITRSQLQSHPVLQGLSVFRMAAATNFKVTDDEWRALMELVGEPPPLQGLTLGAVVDQFARDLQAIGYDYGGSMHNELVRTFITSLATKGFVILTGLSGSGKTKIAQHFGNWLGAASLKIVAVRPDWTNPDALLGYENGLSAWRAGGYAWHVPEVLEFVLQAIRNPTSPYVLVLDEMNLAHVERYFADVLSGMESSHPVVPNLELNDGEWRLVDPGHPRLPMPANLFVVGTVNVDETTYMFSPKVLDRANTIEFRVATDDLQTAPVATRIAEGSPAAVRAFLHAATQPARQAKASPQVEDWMKDLHRRLAEHGREFGHRTFAEASRFADLLSAAGVDDPAIALDLQVLQKVLPKYHGSIRELSESLNDLGAWCFFGPGHGQVAGFDAAVPPVGTPVLPRSFDKIHRMAKRLKANHFVSFAE